MSAYFDHHSISNSDITKLLNMASSKEEPANLQQIFDLGTLNHEALGEPHKAKVRVKNLMDACTSFEEEERVLRDSKTAFAMADTVLKDDLCKKIIMMKDYRREHEWHVPASDILPKANTMGFESVRCKTDGDSEMLGLVFEYKGLAVTSDKSFESALLHHDYDRACYWYLNTTGLDRWLIVGVSKIDTRKIFKRLVDRNHLYYHSGREKLERAKVTYRQLIGPVE
jgi:hypothetical protein